MKSLRPILPPSRKPWKRPRLASCEFLDTETLAYAQEQSRPILLDVHDDAVRQFDALNIPLSPERRAQLTQLRDSNVQAFKLYAAPSETFVELAGLPANRTFIAWNGTDTSIVRPHAWPDDRVVGMVSGAAPQRGIETLIEAVRIVRKEMSDVRLSLWLTATGAESRAYLDTLTQSVKLEGWITITSVGYEDLGATLGSARVLCVPLPANPYMDSATPVKLADSLAAGRPVVVTPRTETRRIVETRDVGLVAAGDEPEDLAEALTTLLADDARARALGERARNVAETQLDWNVIGEQLVAWLRKKLWWF